MVNRHGYSDEAAGILARRLFDPYERCGICGIPNRILSFHLRRGWPFITGNEKVNRRLTVDHIIPGGPSVLSNTRLLCYSCNNFRGPDLRTDGSVLRWISRKYHRLLSKAELWWLNTAPGEGGLHRRGKKHEVSSGT
jgi:hypothetical protein